jgi:hypothetical protein
MKSGAWGADVDVEVDSERRCWRPRRSSFVFECLFGLRIIFEVLWGLVERKKERESIHGVNEN